MNIDHDRDRDRDSVWFNEPQGPNAADYAVALLFLLAAVTAVWWVATP